MSKGEKKGVFAKLFKKRTCCDIRIEEIPEGQDISGKKPQKVDGKETYSESKEEH